MVLYSQCMIQEQTYQQKLLKMLKKISIYIFIKYDFNYFSFFRYNNGRFSALLDFISKRRTRLIAAAFCLFCHFSSLKSPNRRRIYRSSPLEAMETKSPSATMMWSSRRMSMVARASRTCRVAARSSADGRATPLG